MKYGQLVEYNMIHIFLEKSCTKCVRETLPRPFPEKSKLSISLHQWPKPKVLCTLALLYAKLRTMQYIEIMLHTTCFYLIQSFFEK